MYLQLNTGRMFIRCMHTPRIVTPRSCYPTPPLPPVKDHPLYLLLFQVHTTPTKLRLTGRKYTFKIQETLLAAQSRLITDF